MDKHITVVGALKIGLGALGLLITAIVFVVIVGGGFLGAILSEEEVPFVATAFVGAAIAFFAVLFSVPGIIGGIGLLKHRPWARILVLILSIFDLVNVPVGTAIGVYSIWVLMQDETIEIFQPG
jgi:hypothetical protein